MTTLMLGFDIMLPTTRHAIRGAFCMLRSAAYRRDVDLVRGRRKRFKISDGEFVVSVNFEAVPLTPEKRSRLRGVSPAEAFR